MTLVNRKQISLYEEAEAGLNSLVKQTAQVGVGLLGILLLTGGNPPALTVGLSVVGGIAFVAWSEEKRLTKFYARRSHPISFVGVNEVNANKKVATVADFSRNGIKHNLDLKVIVQSAKAKLQIPNSGESQSVELIQNTIKQILESDTDNLSELVKQAGLNPDEDLAGADLSSVKGVGCKLSRFNFSGADLDHADLSRADLSFANLSNAKLTNVKLCRADLSGADLTDALLMDADLSGADLSGADLSCTNLSGADLSHAYLSGANLNYANLNHANLSHTYLSGAYLNHANLSDANLKGANLSVTKLRDANLRGAKLRGANLRGADLIAADLIAADLGFTNLSGADFSHADLRSADLIDANLSNASLSNANLSNANLTATNLSTAKVESARFGNNVGLDEDAKYELKKRGAIFPQEELVAARL